RPRDHPMSAEPWRAAPSGAIARWSPLELARGVRYPLRGYAVLRRERGLLRYAAGPIVLTALALFASAYPALADPADLLALFWQAPSAERGAVLGFLYRTASALSFLLALSVLTFLCVALSTVCAAPFNDALSEAIEERLAGRPPAPFSLTRLV